MVKCPWHGWEFDIRTGKSWCDPSRVRVRQYPVAVKPGTELVEGPVRGRSRFRCGSRTITSSSRPDRADDSRDEVYFEFTAIGRSVKVVAIHAATGTEVSVIGPATRRAADLQRLALQKLVARLKSGA